MLHLLHSEILKIIRYSTTKRYNFTLATTWVRTSKKPIVVSTIWTCRRVLKNRWDNAYGSKERKRTFTRSSEKNEI